MFLDYLIHEYNYQFNKQIKITDIKTWDLLPIIGQEGMQLFCKQGFFNNLKPYPYAIEVVKELNKKHNIHILTKPQNAITMVDKWCWIEEYMPFIKFEQVTMTSHKYDFIADIMIDDYDVYLDKFKINCGGKTIIMDRLYNQNYDYADFRTNNWISINSYIDTLSNN